MRSRPYGRYQSLLGRVGVVAVALSLLLAACGNVSPTPIPSASPSASPAVATPSASVASPPPSQASPSISPAPANSANAALRPGDPNAALTPGVRNPAVTQASVRQTICHAGYSTSIRPPAAYTNALKRTQILAYGYADRSPAHYEEDHLISLELGGSPRDPRNLWPEPHTATLADGTKVGSATKDRFENWLHSQVCSGALPLATAQQEIATDWVGAWLAAGRP